jgi:RNA polymerase sigma-70 factor (ECF subfamily)
MAVGSEGSIPIQVVGQTSIQDVNVRERVIALYENHRDGIYRFLLSHGLSPAEAQEVTQDVFVDLFVVLKKGTRVESELGWLHTVAGRAAVDYWRREGRPVRVELDSEAGPAAQLQSTEPSPEIWAANAQQMRRVAAGMRDLPKEQRLCVQLRMQGLRYREIAGVLGVSTSTAAEWLVAAVNRLRGEAQ